VAFPNKTISSSESLIKWVVGKSGDDEPLASWCQFYQTFFYSSLKARIHKKTLETNALAFFGHHKAMKFVGKTNGSFEPRKWQLILAMATLDEATQIEMILIGNLCDQKIE
jgi:hypothetical protein